MTSDPKQAFRMALKKSPCVKAVGTPGDLKDWRTFRIIQKCHQDCSAPERNQNTSSSTESYQKLKSDETVVVTKLQPSYCLPLFQCSSLMEGPSTSKKAAEESVLLNKNERDDKVNNFSVKNNLFCKYDSKTNDYEIFLDNSKISSTTKAFSDPANLPMESYHSSIGQTPLNSQYSETSLPVNQALQSYFWNSNELNYTCFCDEFNYRKTCKCSATFDSKISETHHPKNEVFFENEKSGKSTSPMLNTPTLSLPTANDSWPSPNSCYTTSNVFQCRSPCCHVPSTKQVMNETVSFEPPNTSLWFSTPGSDYSQYALTGCNIPTDSEYPSCNSSLQINGHDTKFPSSKQLTPFDAETMIISELSNEGQNCLKESFCPSNFCSESMSKSNLFMNGCPFGVKNEVENTRYSYSYLNRDVSMMCGTDCSLISNYISSEMQRSSCDIMTCSGNNYYPRFHDRMNSYSDCGKCFSQDAENGSYLHMNQYNFLIDSLENNFCI